ncbi:MAG TPA: aminotransferase class I/II-fold pyridoxal phosphate-dependent enzyme [Solirubrobacteraceae bacterium]
MTAIEQYQIRASSAAELVRAVEAAVAAGELTPGQRLPSVRQLAAKVGLSLATTASALAELRRRGVVLSEPRRGSRIGEAPPIGAPRAAVPIPPGARDLSRGNPDPSLLPDISSALAKLRGPMRLYGQQADVPELIELARERLTTDGIPAQSLCVVSGALDGIERVLAAHLRPGDRVAVENPGYAALFQLLRARGFGLDPVAIDEKGMLPDLLQYTLKRGAKAVVVTPRGQNPTGAALDGERAERLRAVLAQSPQTLLVEDDHLGEVAGAPLHTLAGASERWAATRSVAKTLGPDLRLAVLAGDRESIDRVQGLQACGPGWVSHILQRTVLALLTDPQVSSLVAHARDIYTRRREHLLDCLKQAGIDVSAPSGLNVWVGVQEESSAVGALLSRGWVVSPGVPYRLGGTSPAIRITVSTLKPVEAQQLAGEIAHLVNAPGGQRSG